jgi:hypothetical protein
VGAVVLLAVFVDDIGLSSKAAVHPLGDDRLELGGSLFPDAVTGLENIEAYGLKSTTLSPPLSFVA